jgi:hypothetical protein
MERPHVIIPSRGRAVSAREITKFWGDEGFNITWLAEPHEADRYWSQIVGMAPLYGPPKTDPPRVIVHSLGMANAGIGFARNQAVHLAHRLGLESFILADDDIKPARKGGNMIGMVEAAKHPKVLGITARYSYHDLCLDLKNKENKLAAHYPAGRLAHPILLSTGTFRMVGLNVENVLRLGNYDAKLEYAEDCDLFLRGLQAGYPWLLHAGTWTNSIGTRYLPGGMLDFAGGKEKLEERKPDWHWDLHDKWPKFTNDHTNKCKGKQNCIRIQWKRAYDHFLPNWREWSDLDGGSIERYLGA